MAAMWSCREGYNMWLWERQYQWRELYSGQSPCVRKQLNEQWPAGQSGQVATLHSLTAHKPKITHWSEHLNSETKREQFISLWVIKLIFILSISASSGECEKFHIKNSRATGSYKSGSCHQSTMRPQVADGGTASRWEDKRRIYWISSRGQLTSGGAPVMCWSRCWQLPAQKNVLRPKHFARVRTCVKLGLSHSGRNTDWVCSRIGCWEKYLGLRGTR